MKKMLSIIIVNYNTKDLLDACLNSLYTHYGAQLQRGAFEILIVDNKSTDDSVSHLKKHHRNITVIENDENTGFSDANNRAIAVSGGEYVLLLNPDTVVREKTLTVLLEYMESHERVGVATPKILLRSGELDDACHRGFPTPLRALFHFSGLSKLFPHSTFFNGYHLGYQNMDTIHEIDAGVGACMMIRRSVGKKLSWLDTDYFWYGEDLDFCYRTKKLGYSVVYVPQVSIVHYKGASSGIKKHSKHLSKIDRETQLKIIHARFEVMRIFYQKHYQKKYPAWIMSLVFFGISCKEFIAKRGIV